MSEYDVKITHLYGDTYRVSAYPSARSVIFALLALLGVGLIGHLMKDYELSFEQAIEAITGGAIALMLVGAALYLWLRPKFDRLFDGGRW